MAKTNFAGPITTGRFQSNGATQVRTAQFLQNSAQFLLTMPILKQQLMLID